MNSVLPALQAENLTKEFPSGDGRIRVLNQINLAILTGESVAIVGPSGSGKSTLIGLLSGLDSPTHGRVLMSGQDLGLLNEEELAQIRSRLIGFVFQSCRLLSHLTAEENARLPLELLGDRNAREKARLSLEKVGLGARLNHRPAQLSGGEQQRVSLARALVHQPRILFADEPTGNLDGKTAGEMSRLIFSLARENHTTLVLVTHELSLAQQADRIVELRDGNIV